MILRDSCSEKVQAPEVRHGLGIALIGRIAVQAQRLAQIFADSFSVLVQEGKGVLRLGVALRDSLAAPLQCLGIIPQRAVFVRIYARQALLRREIPVLSCKAVPFKGLFKILRDSPAGIVHVTEAVRRVRRTVPCGLH